MHVAADNGELGPRCHGNEGPGVVIVMVDGGYSEVAMDTEEDEGESSSSSPTKTLFRDARSRIGADDESMQWEEFFGPTVDLVPSLLDIYDALIASDRVSSDNDNVRSHRLPSTVDRKSSSSSSTTVQRGGRGRSASFQMPNASICPRTPTSASDDLVPVEASPKHRKCDQLMRPLSVGSTSSASSSSSSSLSSSSTNSSSLSRSHGSNKKSYLASIESLEDDDDDDDDVDDDDEEEDDDEDEDEGCVTNGSSRSARQCRTRNTTTTTTTGSKEPTSGKDCPVISAPTLPAPQSSRLTRYCDPNLSHTDRVVLEILDTERTYVRDLQEIVQGYLGHLKDGFSVAADISGDHVNNLFGNVEGIYRFNRDFLAELESCSANPVLVARAFVSHTKGFAIYTEYCTNYPRMVCVLTDLMRRGKTAEIFKTRQAALGHMLPLGSYLLKPVQRILKYHLLLQNMVKHYVKDGRAGYDDVVAALATMTGIACHINDMKRKHEHAIRVQEIQSLLYGWEGRDLTTYGELIAEGTFRVYGAKAVRHVFLFDLMLLVTKKKEDSSLSYKTHIMCSNLMLIEMIPGEPLCFHVIPFDNPRVQHTLQARNLEQKRDWALQLKRVILENYNVDIPSHARELVMQLGQNRPEDEILVERGNGSSKRNHSAPEYLERRYKHDKERRRIDHINRALRIRRGSKKNGAETPSPLLSPSCDGSKVVGEQLPHNRSSSCDRDSSATSESMDNMQRNLSASSLSSQKSKKSRGWRRKSEPCELLSSQESLTSTSNGQKPTAKSKFGRSKSASTAETRPPASDEYVTFFFSSVERSKQQAENIYDVPCVQGHPSSTSTPSPATGGYDNLQNLWDGGSHAVQRTDSLKSNSDYGSMTTSSTATTRRPDALDLSAMNLPPQDDMDAASSPTTPAVWLKQQQDHLAEASLKAGSLPRSFQLKADEEAAMAAPSSGDGLGAFKLRRSVDRPFTIASDKPCKSDLNMDDFERYIEDSPSEQRPYRFPVLAADDDDDDDEEEEEEEDDEPDFDNDIHPDNRIYRPSISRSSLRSLLSNVGSKLIHLRMQSSGKETAPVTTDFQSCSSLDTDVGGGVPCERRSKSAERDRLTNKLLVSVTTIYSKMIRHRHLLKPSNNGPERGRRRVSSPCGTAPSSSPLYSQDIIHKQGSPAIGARMARPMDRRHIDCDSPTISRDIRPPDQPERFADASVTCRPTSAVPDDDDSGKVTDTAEDVKDEIEVRSDVSGDSYYERSFEAMEAILSSSAGDNCRDSALYSDDADESSTSIVGLRPSASNPEKVSSEKTGKQQQQQQQQQLRGQGIMEKLRHLERCSTYSPSAANPDSIPMRSIRERCRDLELCSTRLQSIEAAALVKSSMSLPSSPEKSMLNKGWVKRVVDKLENET